MGGMADVYAGRIILEDKGFLEHELEMVTEYELKRVARLEHYPIMEKEVDLLYRTVLLRQKGFTEEQIWQIINREELARLSIKQLAELSPRGISKIFDLDSIEISVHIVDDEPKCSFNSEEEKLKQGKQKLEQEKKQLAEDKRILKMQKDIDKKLSYQREQLAREREKFEIQKIDYEIEKIDYEMKKIRENGQQLKLQTNENTAQKRRKLVCRNNRIYAIELETKDEANGLQTVKSTPKKKANLFELIKRFISRERERE